VADSVSQILIAGLATLPAATQVPVSQLTAYHREQIKALVRSHLADPDLGVTQIAQALRLSPSTLHRAWAGEPCSLSDWIWSQRLDAARRDLCDPARAARTVSESPSPGASAMRRISAEHFAQDLAAPRARCARRDRGGQGTFRFASRALRC
jgi:AraC-like DNA-binding protein